MGDRRPNGAVPGDQDDLALSAPQRPLFQTFGYKHIEIASFSHKGASLIMLTMSIRNVKIDLLSAAAIGAFALFLLAPLLA